MRTADGLDIGIIGFANHDGEWPPAGSHDCVFMPFAFDPAVKADPCAAFVQEHVGREFMAVITYVDETMGVLLQLDTGWHFELTSGDAGNRWMATRGETTLDGTGAFL